MQPDLASSSGGLVVCRSARDVPPALRRATIAIGNFDGLHLGHRRLIATAVRQAAAEDRPAAILTFDPHPRAFFAPDAPQFRLTPWPVKLAILETFGLAGAFVLPFDAAMAATGAREFIQGLIRADFGAEALVVGSDFHFGRGREGTPAFLADLARETGLGVTIVPTVEVDGAPVSSSRIRDLLAEGRVAEANRLFGYRWFVRGEVVHGAKLGRTLGFPTANMVMDPGCRLAHGIYAVRVAVAPGEVRDGVASFGRRPTFDNGAPLLESYLFEFAGDLYGRTVDVELVGWIRGEARFASAEALVERMREDESEAQRILAGHEGPGSLIG